MENSGKRPCKELTNGPQTTSSFSGGCCCGSVGLLGSSSCDAPLAVGFSSCGRHSHRMAGQKAQIQLRQCTSAQ